jgi:hypothetical protein
MALFSVDLPATFHFSGRTQGEKDRELEEYLRKLSAAVEENMKRLHNRVAT